MGYSGRQKNKLSPFCLTKLIIHTKDLLAKRCCHFSKEWKQNRILSTFLKLRFWYSGFLFEFKQMQWQWYVCEDILQNMSPWRLWPEFGSANLSHEEQKKTENSRPGNDINKFVKTSWEIHWRKLKSWHEDVWQDSGHPEK